MSDHDLDRVRADLATMKSACAEPAIPREEIAVGLIGAVGFAILAAGSQMLPMFWLKCVTVAAAMTAVAFYIPWKRRIVRNDRPRRSMEVKEMFIWGVAAAGMAIYMVSRRFLLSADGELIAWRSDAGAVFFFVGLGMLANGLLHATRRNGIVAALPMLFGGILVGFTTSREATLAVLFVAAALACALNSAGLAWLARRQRSVYVGD